MSATFVLSFNHRTDSWRNDIFFLNLIKTECIVGGLIKISVKLVCGSYLSLGIFMNRFPLHIIRRENSEFPCFASFPANFPKEGQRAKREKYLIVRAHCRWGRLSRKEQKNENYQQLLQILARWVYHGVIYSAKNDILKRLWNNSQNLKITPSRDKTQKLTISDFLAFSISTFSHRMNAPQDFFQSQPTERSVFVVEWE